MRAVAVVLNWRRPQDTLQCVRSLLLVDRPLDIVIVDNDSGDGSLDQIADGLETMPERIAASASLIHATPGGAAEWPVGRAVVLAQSGRNGGYAFGNNIGIALAMTRPDAAFVWVLNNDTTIPGAETLDALVARMAEDRDIGICGATVAYSDAPDTVQTLGGGRFDRKLGRCHPIGIGSDRRQPIDRNAVERQLAYVNGAAAFIRREFIEQVGLMTEDYFLYYEEVDWARRARGSRFRLGFAPDAIVLHEVGASIGTDDSGGGSPLSAYYLARNRLKFLRRFSPVSLPLALIDVARDIYREYRAHRPANAASVAKALIGLPFRSK